MSDHWPEPPFYLEWTFWIIFNLLKIVERRIAGVFSVETHHSKMLASKQRQFQEQEERSEAEFNVTQFHLENSSDC